MSFELGEVSTALEFERITEQQVYLLDLVAASVWNDVQGIQMILKCCFYSKLEVCYLNSEASLKPIHVLPDNLLMLFSGPNENPLKRKKRCRASSHLIWRLKFGRECNEA